MWWWVGCKMGKVGETLSKLGTASACPRFNFIQRVLLAAYTNVIVTKSMEGLMAERQHL